MLDTFRYNTGLSETDGQTDRQTQSTQGHRLVKITTSLTMQLLHVFKMLIVRFSHPLASIVEDFTLTNTGR